MNGPRLFTFALEIVPKVISEVLTAAELTMDDIALVVPHQANGYILDAIRESLCLPNEKLYVYIKHCGNTVSSSIPIALKHASTEGRITSGDLVLLVGFGVGLSWAATIVRWTGLVVI
jgi:3-oxoacyl-[acyl-carrier-protein] synthase-3